MNNGKIFIVDDDDSSLELAEHILSLEGWTVKTTNTVESVFLKIKDFDPDYLITDIMMPIMDGIQLCSKITNNPDFAKITIIVCSSKSYDFDKENAFKQGASGYILKPFTKEKFEDVVNSLNKTKLTFWGIHGTLPVPGSKTSIYGGNTSCVSLEFSPRNLFILDAGSGISELSNHLLKDKHKRINASLCITHTHWDHINAFPFFGPLYLSGNEITVYGPTSGEGRSIEQSITDQMSREYFPITSKEFAAHVKYENLHEGQYEISGVQVQAKLLIHPGNCLGYKFIYNKKIICYLTDNELYKKDFVSYSPNYWNSLLKFLDSCDLLIHDTTYFDYEYERKINWGHSSVNQVVQLAHEANVKYLFLFHHDIAHDDGHLMQKLKIAQQSLLKLNSRTKCFLPKERSELIIERLDKHNF
ncbi:MAG: response regulator [Oligoflexia bacterium]|nr:response regulator [Oligoflexia bacterium]